MIFETAFEFALNFFQATKAAEGSTGFSQTLYVEEMHRVLSVANPD